MTRAYLGIGTNLGDRMNYLQLAVDGLRSCDAVTDVQCSSVYETAPVGGPEQGAYLNAVVEIATSLDPYELLALCNELEARAERVRSVRWGPRTLDVDVLLYDEFRSDDPVLTVPHPRMHERSFVLIPLAEIAPDALVSIATSVPNDDPSVQLFSEPLR